MPFVNSLLIFLLFTIHHALKVVSLKAMQWECLELFKATFEESLPNSNNAWEHATIHKQS